MRPLPLGSGQDDSTGPPSSSRSATAPFEGGSPEVMKPPDAGRARALAQASAFADPTATAERVSSSSLAHRAPRLYALSVGQRTADPGLGSFL